MNKNTSIKCDAVKCVYHTEDNYCSASSIKVGTPASCCSSETKCDTFKCE